MISPDTAPRGITLRAVLHRGEVTAPGRARAPCPGRSRANQSGIDQLDAERQMIDAGGDERVVASKIALGRELHADEQADVAP